MHIYTQTSTYAITIAKLQSLAPRLGTHGGDNHTRKQATTYTRTTFANFSRLAHLKKEPWNDPSGLAHF